MEHAHNGKIYEADQEVVDNIRESMGIDIIAMIHKAIDDFIAMGKTFTNVRMNVSRDLDDESLRYSFVVTPFMSMPFMVLTDEDELS